MHNDNTLNGYDTLEDLFKAVGNINQEFYEKTGSEYICATIETNTYVTNCNIFNIAIWSSEDHYDRFYDEEKDEYEPLEGFLKRNITEEIKKIAKFIE
jgi:hypothetical protein